MKSTEIVLITSILTDVSIMCNTSMDRDLKTIKSRVAREGLSFLTITLPTFGKAFEKSLEEGSIQTSLFPAFAKKRGKKSALIPRFLSGIMCMVFDPEDGALRKHASIEAIDSIRQICLTFNKLKKETTDERKAKAIRAFLECEADLGQVHLNTWSHRGKYRDVSRIVFGGVFYDLQENLFSHGLVPRHGPGAVVEKLSGNAKYRNRTWTRRLDRAMPTDNYLFSNTEAWLAEHESLEYLEKRDEKPVKVIFVPKTAKTPRVIAIEPVYMQYVQQAFLGELVPALESDPIIGKSVHFTDSSINGSLAREASKTRKYATLDMSEASDRVHAALVSDLFGNYPDLRKAIFACRSSKALLPTGDIISLKKFASMGSALCFPVESMVFFALCITAGLLHEGKPASKPSIKAIAAKITIFGDDIIIPVAWRWSVTHILESVGLRVNSSKSFSKGFFRESCGVDAYQGHLVTPVYVRTSAPANRHDAEELLSWVASSNLFYKKGYWNAAQCMRGILENLHGFLPHVTNDSSAVGWKSFMNYYSVERWNKVLSRFETHCMTVHSRSKKDHIDGYDRLLKFHLAKEASQRCENLSRRKTLLWNSVQEIRARGFALCSPLDAQIASEFVPSDWKEFSKILSVGSSTDPERSTLRGSVYTKRRWTTTY